MRLWMFWESKVHGGATCVCLFVDNLHFWATGCARRLCETPIYDYVVICHPAVTIDIRPETMPREVRYHRHPRDKICDTSRPHSALSHRGFDVATVPGAIG